MRYGFYFWSGFSTLDFGEWGIVFHVLAFCNVVSTEVLSRREGFLQHRMIMSLGLPALAEGGPWKIKATP